MSERAILVLASAGAGALLGGLLVLGLLVTVRRLPRARRPGRLALASAAARIVACGAGIVLASGGDPVRLLACVGGFVLARQVGVRAVAARLA